MITKFMLILRNWKTSLSGALLLGLTGAMLANKITIEQFSIASGALVSLGLLNSKDVNK